MKTLLAAAILALTLTPAVAKDNTRNHPKAKAHMVVIVNDRHGLEEIQIHKFRSLFVCQTVLSGMLESFFYADDELPIDSPVEAKCFRTPTK